MEQFINIVLLFFVFSLVGWLIEVFLKYRQYGRFINRGFLMGPWLPIYGSGAVLITVSVRLIAGLESGILTTFVISFIVCGFIEYMASYVMEKRYHARWWDYTQKPMNLNGRVWIGNLILFGLGGVIIIELANPLLFHFFDIQSLRFKELVAGCLAAVFIFDFIMSRFVMKLVKSGIEKSEADNTEEIGREIRGMLADRNIFYRRFADAYPEVIYRTDKIKARMEAVKAETERLRREAEERLSEIKEKVVDEKNQLIDNFEPATMIKTTIIENQEKLISLLYDEENATDEMKVIKDIIDSKKDILESRNIKAKFKK